MVARLRALVEQHREIIAYAVVGAMTTVVAWGSKFLFNAIFYAGTLHPDSFQNLVLSVVNWVCGVAFAYPANRRWVFQSKNDDILREAAGFVASRAATLVLDIAAMQLLGNVCHLDLVVATLVSSGLVIVANYVLSKWVVFRKGASRDDEDEAR